MVEAVSPLAGLPEMQSLVAQGHQNPMPHTALRAAADNSSILLQPDQFYFHTEHGLLTQCWGKLIISLLFFKDLESPGYLNITQDSD